MKHISLRQFLQKQYKLTRFVSKSCHLCSFYLLMYNKTWIILHFKFILPWKKYCLYIR